MASKRLILAVLSVVIIVIAASATYALFYYPSSQPSALEQMALTKDDLGTDWQGDFHSVLGFSPPTYEDYLINETYDANIWLVAYNNVSECKYWYDTFLGNYRSYENWTFVNVTIGDDSFLAYYGSDARPMVELVFTRGVIWCHIMADEYSRVGKPWWIDTTIWIAQLQLDKIDQYLVQHPGAS